MTIGLDSENRTNRGLSPVSSPVSLFLEVNVLIRKPYMSRTTQIVSHKFLGRNNIRILVGKLPYRETTLPAIASYALHLLTASVLLVVFFLVYTWITPIDELLLIRQGNNAATLSLGGALIGFSLPIASSLLHTSNYVEFLGWAVGSMVVQVLAYAVTVRLLHISREHIESGNTAFGGLMGAISISIGAINAGCIS
jgi:putative membrane protein